MNCFSQLVVGDLKTYSSLNPLEDPFTPQGVALMDLKQVFGILNEEGFKLKTTATSTPYTALTEPNVANQGAMAKLKIWNYDPSDTDDTDGDPKGAGTLIYGIFSDVTSTEEFTGKSWNIQKSSGIGAGVETFYNVNYPSNTIKQSITAALFYADQYSDEGIYQTTECTPDNSLFGTWNWWDQISNKDLNFNNRTDCGVWGFQPVIISLEAKNVEIDSVAIPGMGKLPGKYFNMIERKRELKTYRPDYTMVLAHRSFWKDHPENSAGAINAAIDETDADIIEFDVRLTSDGKIVAMHDAFVDRLVENLSGWTSDFTLEQLQAQHLKDRLGRVTTEKMLSLSEALDLAKGKALIYLDTKSDPKLGNPLIQGNPPVWALALEVVKEKNMLDQVIFTGSENYQTMANTYPEFNRGELLLYQVHDKNNEVSNQSYLNDRNRTTGFVIRIFNDTQEFDNAKTFANAAINKGFRFYYFSNFAQYWSPDKFEYQDKPIYIQFDSELDRRGDFDWMITNNPGVFIADRVDAALEYLTKLGKREKNN